MNNGGRGEARSGTGSQRHSIDGQYISPKTRWSRPETPRSEPIQAYPTYDCTPASVSGATDLDYDYDERDLGLTQQARPPISVRFSDSSRSHPHSQHSAPGAPSNCTYSTDYDQIQYRSPASPRRSTLGADPYGQSEVNDHRLPPRSGEATYWYAGPPSSSHSSHGYFSTTLLSHDLDPRLFGISAPHHHAGHHQTRQDEVLPSFPHWSRSWYDGHLSPNGHAYTSISPAQSGQGGWESDSMKQHGAMPGAYGDANSHRGMTDNVKEERMRRLEREFGRPKVTHKGTKEYCEEVDAELDEDDDLPLGSVSSKGRIITERPRWNLAMRILQVLVALIACACGIGGLILVKTTTDKEPAPKGTYPAYILYGCQIITLVALLYFHIFRACCCDPMRKEIQSGLDSNSLGGMVIPILTAGGAGRKQKKFGKKMQQNQSPTVNLIVDPSLLSAMSGGKGKRDRDDSDDDDERLPGDARRSSKRKNGLGVFGNMQMQRRWRLARRSLKLLTTLDVILCFIWIACDVVTLSLGKKCPASLIGMWCTLYNIAMACGVILAIFFAAAIYFDYRDLKVSRSAPKPPM
jgi:TRAP-type C4-dicarboxylate transport system permease small subunit